MVYKNCILGKKLSGLDMYVSIFLFAFIITVVRFFKLLLFFFYYL